MGATRLDSQPSGRHAPVFAGAKRGAAALAELHGVGWAATANYVAAERNAVERYRIHGQPEHTGNRQDHSSQPGERECFHFNFLGLDARDLGGGCLGNRQIKNTAQRFGLRKQRMGGYGRAGIRRQLRGAVQYHPGQHGHSEDTRTDGKCRLNCLALRAFLRVDPSDNP